MTVDNDLSRLRIDKQRISQRQGKKKRYLLLSAALLLIILLVILYFKGVLKPALEVQVISVQRIYPAQTFTLLNASGYAVAQRKAAVASKITGRLVFLGVEEGSQVKKGEIIARLENDDAKAAMERAKADAKVAHFNLEQSQAELDDAVLDYNRKKELVEKEIIARSQFDAAEARFKKAKAAVAAYQAALRASEAALKEVGVSLEYTIIRAPFDAVVLTKNADIGDIVTPIGAAADAKAAVVNIADMDSLKVEVDVSESNIEQVKVGQPCEIQLDALPNDRFRGVVHMIVPTADRSKASILVKAAFLDKDPRILPEMSAKVAFLSRQITPEEENPFKALPSNAVVNREGETLVFVVQNNRALKTPVHLGRRLDTMVEILDGVEVGDQVATAPLDKIKNGIKVRVAQE
ncbi:MAG: efflux RND transporter periplasmic adaptor subunit [Deltaproteobacteria bacterium]|nr:MAG: efflux RND transporter periplasmic adaptor subunit [Deltaproteobacteria bacterium]